ncbi:MAG: HAMP domain-containing sensor histidine kinase [Eubacteriales bacterium]|nr:HAMP domain-containing sensor histidine kinase [Eubacteriales bacterium]
MFKRSKRKIVAAIMAVLVLLYIGTLAVIYGCSYFEVSAANREMLERYTELFSLENQPGEDQLPEIPERLGKDDSPEILERSDKGDSPEITEGRLFKKSTAFRLTTFYSVAISDSGEILATDNENEDVYEDAVLQEYATEITESKKDSGVKGSLLYMAVEKEGYTLVAFMDNTIMQQSITTLLRYTILFGGIMLAVLFVVAVYLAGKIVKPLEESHQKQKQFISDAGHELKTPISVVSANAELLEREIGENPWLANIRYENEKMGKLVGQLLELTRMENVEVQTEYLDFSRLVRGEALPFECIAFEQGLILNCDIAEGIFLEGNSGQLKQIVSILLDNAICYGQDGKEVVLRLKEEHGFAKLSVINAGKEIPPEQRSELFERFYRADVSRSGEDEHYGLGLSIAKAIAVAHKGKINVFCYDGKVEFAVSLPLKK